MAFISLPGSTVGGLPVAMPTIGSVDGGSAPAKEQGRGERQGFAPCFPVACGALWGNRTVGLFLFWLAAASCALWEVGGNVGLVEITGARGVAGLKIARFSSGAFPLFPTGLAG